MIQAHNVPLMAIPTMGESWHCNHHAFPSSARHGLYPGQIDLGWRFIQLLEMLGLAWNIKLPANAAAASGHQPGDGAGAERHCARTGAALAPDGM